MRKQETVDLEDSNVAGLGGKEDRELRKTSALGEPAWKFHQEYLSGVFLTDPKLREKEKSAQDSSGKWHHMHIWRIEKFKVIPWPREEYGQFYSGDSYIILHHYQDIKRNKQGKPEEPQTPTIVYDLHFWLGNETSQDEQGTAAYKVVEFDTLLDDAPVQRRETQGNESELFVNAFRVFGIPALTYNEGGVDSGFNKVKPEEYKPRLMHMKGKKKVRVSPVALAWSSLNSGDVFVLDMGTKCYVFIGKEAGKFEKNTAALFVVNLKSQRRGKVECFTINEDENKAGSDDPNVLAFCSALGAKPGATVNTAASGGADEEEKPTKKVMYRLKEKKDGLAFTLEAENDACLSNRLDSNDAFVLDFGCVVYGWVGSKASDAERAGVMKHVQEYVKQHNLPKNISQVAVFDGKEPDDFWKFFN